MQKLRLLSALAIATPFFALAQRPAIVVHADQIRHRITPYLTGACVEDVNHEVYGGIDSQMIFGESFAEPSAPRALKNFHAYDGQWTPDDHDQGIKGVGSNGAKIIWDGSPLANGEVSVDVMLTEASGGNGGLILKVSDPGKGADAFSGYEVSLERPGFLVIGRHRQNWEPLQRVPCDVPVNAWIHLSVRVTENSLTVSVNGKQITRYVDAGHPLETGGVGLRIWQHEVHFRNFLVSSAPISFAYADNTDGDQVSGMWQPIRDGMVNGSFSLTPYNTFSGHQSQQINFVSGPGVLGIENQGLNRQGMSFVRGQPYEGYIYARSSQPAAEFYVSLENKDGSEILAQQRIEVPVRDWQRFNFYLTPNAGTTNGRFAIKLKEPASLSFGYAFLEPGQRGRFHGLPVRKDVAEGLLQQGVTAMRYGGCMANAAQYRWKNMVGPRAKRPPYEGWWYPYSSDGWGMMDFLNFCEAAKILPVPDVNCNETPDDLADFVQYVNGSSDTPWGQRRATDGHPQPYHLTHLEIGNEERVDDSYWQKFKKIAEAIWARDPDIILVVGDFSYHQRIDDPFQFTGADGHITSLAAQQKILQLAKAHDREVWFDVHVNTEGPQPDFGGTFSYIDAIDKLAEGAKHHVVIFEYNAGNHSMRRALANAAANILVQRDGRLPFISSANCLQVDGQNDNSWDQGLLFLNPSQVWLQPPGYVTQMFSRNYEPLVVASEIQNAADKSIYVCATKSEDAQNLVLELVNSGDQNATLPLQISGFTPRHTQAQIETMTGDLNANNTASEPDTITPLTRSWTPNLDHGQTTVSLPPRSIVVIRF